MMGTPVDACGLEVYQEFPFLAASSDSLVGDDICVEVKCPYAVRTLPITKVTVPFLNK